MSTREESSDYYNMEAINSFDDILIQGSTEFIAKTKEALDLLSKTDAYKVIAPYLKHIWQHDKSGLNVNNDEMPFEVGRKTWDSDAIWYASCIAHDGFHALIAKEIMKKHNGLLPSDYWSTETRTDEESRCFYFQIEALKQMKRVHAERNGKTSWQNKLLYWIYINSCRRSMLNPTHHLIPLEKRDW